MNDIKEHTEPARRKFVSACNEYVETHPKISFSHARTLIDIFKVAWPEIVDLYDHISQAVIIKSVQVVEQEEYKNLLISDWAYYRLSLTQYMLTALLMGDSKKIISEAEAQIFQPEQMDTDQTAKLDTIEARSRILVPKVSLESKSFSESTLIGRSRSKANLSGIELSVPGQSISRFAKLTKEGGFDLTSLDKEIAPSDKKSDMETKKSVPAKEPTQETVRKRTRQAPADFQHREKQQIEFEKKRSHQQENFEEMLQAFKLREAARAATVSEQRLNTGTPRIFYRTSLTRPPITRQTLSAKVPKGIATPLFSGPSDPDIIIETSTPSDKAFK
ncbi:MAG: hypothetical protein GY861_26010, partial [bacterium]|nr:hypothetical protein [bacterium]